MESKESILAQVERFEAYCLRKRNLEGDIESTLIRTDEKAVGVVERAEFELEKTKGECAELEARFEKARRGDFEKAEPLRIPLESGLHSSLDVREDGGAPEAHSAALANSAPDEPIQPEAVIPSSSIATSAADSDDFSVVSTQPQGASRSTDEESSSDHSRDDASDELLPLLVQRYTDLCHERRTLQEEIEDRLERKERMAAERLRCAKIALETTRQRAVEIVAALNEASGGDTKIDLPAAWISPAADHGPGSGPMETQFTIANAPIIDPVKPVTPPSPPKETTPPPSIVVPPEPDTVRSSAVEHLSQSVLRRMPAAQMPAATPPAVPAPLPQLTFTTTQQAIFAKYEELMVAAKTAGSGVSMEKVPWPLLTPTMSQYPHKNITASHLENSRVTAFVEGYARWKSWNLQVEGKSILADWEQLHSQVPERKTGGRACMQKVVWILRILVRS